MRKTSVSIITWLSAIIISVVVFVPPAAYFMVAYNYAAGSLQTEADINADLISPFVSSHPEFWRYQQARLEGYLARRPERREPEIRRIIDDQNRVAATSADALRGPVLTRSAMLYDAGSPVARLEISRSLRPLILQTCVIAVLMLLLGAGAFLVIRIIPIRALKKAEESLDNTNEFLKKVMESTTNAILVVDTGGSIVHINERICEMSGLTPYDLIGKSFYALFTPETRTAVQENIENIVTHSRAVSRFDARLIGKDNRTLVVSLGAAPFFHGVKITGSVVSIDDVTEQKRVEEELMRVQRIESLGVLAGGIAHDFNNLLTGVLGNIEMARMFLKPEEKAFKRLVEAEKASLRAKDLTQQLLTFSRGGAPVRKTLAIIGLLRGSVEFSLRGSNVTCTFSLPDDLWPVDADEGQINQVINNLVINAVQAMPAGGVIEVSGENIPAGRIEEPGLNKGRYIKITVRDYGQGIPLEHLNRIFDPYFTTKKTGSGLGLTTVFSIVKKHEGFIRVESKLGKGTAFHLYLPAAGAAPPTAAEHIEGRRGKGKILIMDDEEVIRDVSGEMLREMGYAVETARDGAEALSLYHTAKDSGRPFDAVIMDLTVAGGMGGKQAVEELLAMDPSARAVVSSGYSSDPVMADYRKYGFRAVVTKPYKMDDLCRTIEQVISG